MAWIKITPVDEWDDDLIELVGGEPGRVDAIMAVHSLNSRGMAAHQAVYASAMCGTPTLRKVDRELVAFVVSQTNDCHY